uniref:Uncharacterized protein n=1 Tax=Picea sitchensis TaxID=3332 RepID=A0A6B9XTQ6_PICSI|nr:hypothetical protein Q903MT_gene5487 [Picea sitchensis]
MRDQTIPTRPAICREGGSERLAFSVVPAVANLLPYCSCLREMRI